MQFMPGDRNFNRSPDSGAGAKFVPELRPSPVEQYGEKDDWLIVRGQVYKKEEKEKYQILYLKKCSVYFQKDQQSQQNQQSQQSLIKESRMLIYDEKKNKIQIGNEVEAEGKLSFLKLRVIRGILIRKPIIKGRIFTEKYGVKLKNNRPHSKTDTKCIGEYTSTL